MADHVMKDIENGATLDASRRNFRKTSAGDYGEKHTILCRRLKTEEWWVSAISIQKCYDITH